MRSSVSVAWIHEDGEICLHLGGVVGARVVGLDMQEHIKAPKDDAERVAPTLKGGGKHVKSDGN
jgi:hypothetical protein